MKFRRTLTAYSQKSGHEEEEEEEEEKEEEEKSRSEKPEASVRAGHVHLHGAVDPNIFSTEKGIRAVKISFVGLMITALFQIVIVWFSGSVALLADTIHNFGDAATAIPLGFAFLLARKKPNKRFTYGYGQKISQAS